MALTSDQACKTVQISYPAQWKYKIIGKNEDHLKVAIGEILEQKDHEVAYSNASKNSKYLSLQISLTVESESERVQIFETFKYHEHIDFVL